MNKVISGLMISGLAVGLAACSTTKQEVGVGTGAVVGGAAGAVISHGNPAATVGGAVVGGVIGGAIGKSMDDVDHAKLNQALESNKTNQSSSWSNGNNSKSYTITPTRTFTGAKGEPCRDFTLTSVLNGQSDKSFGTACRDGSGKWRIISS